MTIYPQILAEQQALIAQKMREMDAAEKERIAKVRRWPQSQFHS